MVSEINSLNASFSHGLGRGIFIEVVHSRVQPWPFGLGGHEFLAVLLDVIPVRSQRNASACDIPLSLVLHYILIVIAEVGLVQIVLESLLQSLGLMIIVGENISRVV